MYQTIITRFGEALLLRESLPRIQTLDGIIFDFDGVLVDVGESIQQVHAEAARLYLSRLGWINCEGLVEPSDVDAFKLAGGFNNDWDLAYAWLLLYLFKGMRKKSSDGQVVRCSPPSLKEFAGGLSGGLGSAMDDIRKKCTFKTWKGIMSEVDRAELVRLFKEVYSGDLCPEVYGFKPETVIGKGLIHRDRPILDRSSLPPVRVGIATGRTLGETIVSRRLMGWEDLFPIGSIVSEDDGFLKPDPRVLELAAKKLGVKQAIYVGDTPDDLRTVQSFGFRISDFGFLACMVLSGHGSELRDYFIAEKADVIADNVNAALAAVASIMHA